MTPIHGLVIVAAIVAVLICGEHPTCAANMSAVADIAKMVIAGALGNAMGRHSLDALKPRRRPPKKGEAKP